VVRRRPPARRLQTVQVRQGHLAEQNPNARLVTYGQEGIKGTLLDHTGLYETPHKKAAS
jgi:hypothetical protein